MWCLAFCCVLSLKQNFKKSLVHILTVLAKTHIVYISMHFEKNEI